MLLGHLATHLFHIQLAGLLDQLAECGFRQRPASLKMMILSRKIIKVGIERSVDRRSPALPRY